MLKAIDNASFHHSQTIDEIVSVAGCELWYLPPYSPDLNKIEPWCETFAAGVFPPQSFRGLYSKTGCGSGGTNLIAFTIVLMPHLNIVPTCLRSAIVGHRTGKIICTAYGTDRKHDFHLFKDSQVAFAHSQICLADSGYQGIVKLHSKSCTPSKKPCNTHLPESHRQYNRLLACWCVVAEHTNRRKKDFSHLS